MTSTNDTMLFFRPIRSSFRGPRLYLAVVCLAVFQYGQLRAQKSTSLIQIVKPADPALTWAVPPPVPFGTALDATELNATAGTPGRFVYSPTAGSIPASGQDVLSVVFTPENPNFLTASASVTLAVTPPGSSTFSLAMSSVAVAGESIVLKPGQPTEVPLTVAPIGDFHQPIAFSCGETGLPVVCVFSPAVVRPVTSATKVTLTLTPRGVVHRPPRGDSSTVSPDAFLLPFAFFGLLLLRDRNRWRTRCQFIMLSFACLTSLTGCSFTGERAEPRQIQVIAKSLVESQTISLPYILETPP